MPEHNSAEAKADRVRGKDINGQVVILERTQPRQLSLFQTFLSDEERYSNTIELYDAVPKYFSNHKIMTSMRKSGQYLPILKRTFEHKGETYVLYVRPARIMYANGEEMEYYPSPREELVEEALRKIGWCPSIAWMKYAQRAHACCQLLMHGIRSTSGWGSGMRPPPLSSGGGVLRCVRRTAEIPSRDAGPDSRSFGSRSLSAVRVLDRPNRNYPVTPSMAAGMMDSVWTMEALLAGPARPVSDQRHCVALSSTLSRDTTEIFRSR